MAEGTGFEPVWGFSCQVVFWFVGGPLFGARKSFFVPSPAIRFAESRSCGVLAGICEGADGPFAELMVRIRLSPAESQQTFGSSQYRRLLIEAAWCYRFP